MWQIWQKIVGSSMVAAGGIADALVQRENAKAQAALTRAQAKQTLLNAAYQADVDKQNAFKVMESAGIAEFNARKQQESHLKNMEARIAANGVEMSGSALDVLVEQARTFGTNNEYQIQQYRNAQTQYLVNAENTMIEGQSQYQGLMDRAKYIKKAGNMQFVTNLLKTSNDVAETWMGGGMGGGGSGGGYGSGGFDFGSLAGSFGG